MVVVVVVVIHLRASTTSLGLQTQLECAIELQSSFQIDCQMTVNKARGLRFS